MFRWHFSKRKKILFIIGKKNYHFSRLHKQLNKHKILLPELSIFLRWGVVTLYIILTIVLQRPKRREYDKDSSSNNVKRINWLKRFYIKSKTIIKNKVQWLSIFWNSYARFDIHHFCDAVHVSHTLNITVAQWRFYLPNVLPLRGWYFCWTLYIAIWKVFIFSCYYF